MNKNNSHTHKDLEAAVNFVIVPGTFVVALDNVVGIAVARTVLPRHKVPTA